jgi:hypothetical protein
MAWFDDCTSLGFTPEWKEQITRECIDQGYIPIIDFDESLGWVFHTMLCPNGTVSRKEIAKRFRGHADHHSEQGLEGAIAKALRAQGHRVRCQVRCKAGVADIVTDDRIIEVKRRFSRDELFKAVGQVLTYRQSINPRLRPVIIARTLDNEARSIVPNVEALGVEVVLWSN